MNSIHRGIASSLPFGRGDGTKQLCSNPAGFSDSEKERDLWADPGEGRCVCLSSALSLELALLSASLRPGSLPVLHPELAADPSLEEQSQGTAGRAETKSLLCCFPKSLGGCRGRASMRWDQPCKTAQGCARHPEDRRPSGVSKD